METVSKFFGQDAESKLKAAEALVTQKEQELADAKTALSALQAPAVGTVGSDGVPGGRRKKSRRGGKKSRKLTARRK
jgi:hypothetical protein